MRVPLVRQLAARRARLRGHRRRGGRGRALALVLGRGQRLRALAAVAVHGDGLEAEAPGLDVGVRDVLRRRVGRHVDGLGDGAGEEGLHRRHHLDVAHVVDRALAVGGREGAVEDGEVLGLEVRRALDRLLLVDVLDDVLDLSGAVARACLSVPGTDWLTIFITPPPTSFLYLTSAMSGSMPVVSQSIMKPMVPVGASTVTWLLR